nr:adenosylcobinamide-GDP ribazoletransferase [Desulfobacterales bacterium]
MIIRDFISCLQFLTVLPLGRPTPFDAPRTVPLFPAAGLFIGSILAVADYLFRLLWTVPVASLLDILLLALITGGLHLDGLSDTADGAFSHRSAEEALEIMKDSHVGVMGVLAVIFVISLKWAGVSYISDQRALHLLIIPAYSRGAMMIGIRALKYGRPEGGTGKDFFSRSISNSRLTLLAFPVLLSILLGWSRCLILNGIFVTTVFFVLNYYRRHFHCITGDMLGAIAEVTESVMFLGAGIYYTS